METIRILWISFEELEDEKDDLKHFVRVINQDYQSRVYLSIQNIDNANTNLSSFPDYSRYFEESDIVVIALSLKYWERIKEVLFLCYYYSSFKKQFSFFVFYKYWEEQKEELLSLYQTYWKRESGLSTSIPNHEVLFSSNELMIELYFHLYRMGLVDEMRYELAGPPDESAGIPESADDELLSQSPTTLSPAPYGPEPLEISDILKCSVFAPSAAYLGQTIMVQTFAHIDEQEGEVFILASQFDETATLRGKKLLNREVQRGSELTFCFTMNNVEIDDPVQQLTWLGDPDGVQFGVCIPENSKAGNYIGTVYITQDSVPFGHVKFLLKVVRAEKDLPKEHSLATDTWKRYEYAFISYASPDRSEVLKRVQILPQFHIQYFQDLLTLEPGMRWKKELYKEIDKCDVFLLFWSSAAKSSRWVMREVKYALKKKIAESDPPEIIPVIIEGPPPVSPPKSLKHLHFNDKFIYFINSK